MYRNVDESWRSGGRGGPNLHFDSILFEKKVKKDIEYKGLQSGE